MAPPDIPARLLRLAEALVFASPRPATWRLLAPFLPAHLSADDVFAALAAQCAERGVVLVQQADGWVFRTAPDLNAELQAALGEVRRLPRVALEVLVVIAYHQPITRREIEAVRGVSLSQATMELLLETGLIRAHGRRETPGTPTLWVTTPLFLEQFGLKSLRDLPGSGVIAAVPLVPRPRGPGSPADERAADDAAEAEPPGLAARDSGQEGVAARAFRLELAARPDLPDGLAGPTLVITVPYHEPCNFALVCAKHLTYQDICRFPSFLRIREHLPLRGRILCLDHATS